VGDVSYAESSQSRPTTLTVIKHSRTYTDKQINVTHANKSDHCEVNSVT